MAAAREVFAERGYAGATVRMIAERAGVDPALVIHYVGSKSGLLAAAVDWTFDLDRARRQVLRNGPDRIGHRLARLFVEVWDSAGDGHPVLVLLRVAGTEPLAAEHLVRLLRERLLQPLWPALAEHTGIRIPAREQARRGALVASQLLGLATTRYILRLEPVAGSSPGSLARSVGPTLQRYLTGKLT